VIEERKGRRGRKKGRGGEGREGNGWFAYRVACWGRGKLEARREGGRDGERGRGVDRVLVGAVGEEPDCVGVVAEGREEAEGFVAEEILGASIL
jgi:hypothetical protein